MKYVTLFDGGLVDNFGPSGFSIGILAAQRGHDPYGKAGGAGAARRLSGTWANSLSRGRAERS